MLAIGMSNMTQFVISCDPQFTGSAVGYRKLCSVALQRHTSNLSIERLTCCAISALVDYFVVEYVHWWCFILGFQLHDVIPTSQFHFGGAVGNKETVLIFQRVNRWTCYAVWFHVLFLYSFISIFHWMIISTAKFNTFSFVFTWYDDTLVQIGWCRKIW